jgi:hypothetical protein
MPRRLSVALVVLLAGCFPSEEIDPADLTVSIADYRDWTAVEPLLGTAPGHGDTYRVLYVNDAALAYTGGGFYPEGSAMVKEIYDLAGTDGRGDLRYIAAMRRFDEDTEPELPLDEGWLFTSFDEGDTTETQNPLCWSSCHRQAPYQGAWFDYSRW